MLKLGTRLTDDNFVAALADGSPMQPTFISHEWVRIINATDLPRLRFHDLRHAHATHMLSFGIYPKVASERLGHSRAGLRSIFTATFCWGCRRMRPPRWMRLSRRLRNAPRRS